MANSNFNVNNNLNLWHFFEIIKKKIDQDFKHAPFTINEGSTHYNKEQLKQILDYNMLSLTRLIDNTEGLNIIKKGRAKMDQGS